MTLRAVPRHRLAESLLAAEVTHTPRSPLTAEQPDLTVADGYAIQRETLRLRRRTGDRRIGWRVGPGPGPGSEPVAGHVMASGLVADGETLPFDRFVAPALGAVIAVVMARDLAGPRVTVVDALRAGEGAAAALEILDSRVAGPGTAIDVVADNGGHAAVVTGVRLVPLAGLDLRLEGVTVEHRGRLVATAAGAAALGHPLTAVVWLARHLATLGGGLKAGDLVLTGALIPGLTLARGDTVRATFTRLGAVGVRIA